MFARIVLTLFLIAWSNLAVAQSNIIGGGVFGDVKVSSGCSQATTFLARTSGLSGTETTAYTNMICGMVTDGTWAKLDALYIFATNTTTTALLNLVSTSFTATSHGSGGTFTADHGYTGNISGSFYIDTGFVLTAAAQYTLNSAAFGIYDLTSRSTSENSVGIGTIGANADITRFQVLNSSSSLWSINGNYNETNAASQAQGLWFLNRTANSSAAMYLNGNTTPIVTDTTHAAAAIPTTNNLYILAQNNSGTASSFTADQYSAAWVGGGFSATDMHNFSTRLNAYMTALGINVY